MSTHHRSPEALTLPLDSPRATLATVGGKGASLARLAAAGLPVPPGFHVTTEAYRAFVAANHLGEVIQRAARGASAADPASLTWASAAIGALIAQGDLPLEISEAVRDAYAALGDPDLAVAVRSSATAEDLPELSFAGQQESYLNVRGAEAVIAAVQRCWASLWTARAIGYRARQGIDPAELSLAVVVQRLVPAEAAGILFTANPLTGARDEVMINAAWGLGEAIVSGQVTPDSFVVDKVTQRIRRSEIADKAVQTTRTAEGTREEPVPSALRGAPSLSTEQVADLARLGLRIEELYGHPVDVEWAIADGAIAIVQARPITALPEPRTALDWTPPSHTGRYARGSVIELLPEPLSTLFESMALPRWNRAMDDLLGQMGFRRYLDKLTTLVTINGFAYYDYSLTARETMALLATFLFNTRAFGLYLGRARTRWADEARPRYQRLVARLAEVDASTAPAARLLADAEAIVDTAADYYLAIQSGILPVAYMGEAAFTQAYGRLARRAGDPPALTYLLGFDSEPIRAEKALFDLAEWARGHPDLAALLGRLPSTEIAAALHGASAPGVAPEVWQAFTMRFADHLGRYGDAIYDLDFSKPLPADDPAPLLEALKSFLAGDARSPYQRQAASAAAREAATAALLGRLRGPRRRLLRWLLGGSQTFAPLREDALADVGLGWPLLRRKLLAIGARAVAGGALPDADAIFWLSLDEARALCRALDTGTPADAGLQARVAERRERYAVQRTVTPPVTLPLKGGATFLGVDFSRFMPAHSQQADGHTFKGIGASPGRVTGRARVILGPGDFQAMRQGDILVTKITTPAWTPLFALAAGIVTDVGGPLSHSSIVAREYGIPAVLGTGVATARVADGATIVVDGDAGTVTLV